MAWIVTAACSFGVFLGLTIPTLWFVIRHPSAQRLRVTFAVLLLSGAVVAGILSFLVVIPYRGVTCLRGIPSGLVVDETQTWLPWFLPDREAVCHISNLLNFAILLFVFHLPMWATLLHNFNLFCDRLASEADHSLKQS